MTVDAEKQDTTLTVSPYEEGSSASNSVDGLPKDEQSPPEINTAALEVPDGGLVAWMQVSGSFLLFTNSWGILNSFGVFETYYVSINLSGKSSSQIAWIGSLQAFLLLIVGIFSGPFFDLGFFRPLMLTGSIIVVLGLVFTSLCKEYWQLILAQGILTGIGCGLFFVPSVAIVPQYFDKKRALALGIAASGSSVGGVIYPIIFHKLHAKIGFGWSIRVIALIVLVTQTYVVAIMRTRVKQPRKRVKASKSVIVYPPFLAFVGFGFFGFMGVYIPFFYMEGFSLLKGIFDADMSFYTLAIMNAASTFGRLLPNALADKIGPFNVLVPCLVATSVLMFCWIPATDKAGVILISILYGFFSGSIISLSAPCMSVMTPDIAILGTRMGVLFAISSLGLLVGTPVAGQLLKTHLQFEAPALFGGSVLILSAILLTVSRLLYTGPVLMAKA
ncbi:major facilitator superfamily domain-containing protein [Myxozyma melibiosi]|uniref:Major facilitator superfamily domain-containing protein n=1 Tax=Myxozyma melibiosi TaxID=54550 RepID=A0ABR1EXT0_9ASCO